MKFKFNLQKFPLSQIYQMVAAVLFLIGAVFMLFNTFADKVWAFWTGLGFALAASVAYIMMVIEAKRVLQKKLTDSSYSDKKDNTIVHEKNETKTETPEDKPAKTKTTKTRS
ncbi:MAG: hypothetical protein LBG88_02995 [Christensenellaceae bacterium]|jgi:type III secretory pathway component EscT|nr:hypothetical protein [Christensenellaceae bacterium]